MKYGIDDYDRLKPPGNFMKACWNALWISGVIIGVGVIIYEIVK